MKPTSTSSAWHRLMHSRIFLLCLVLSGAWVPGAIASMASPSAAFACSETTHCYGTANWNMAGSPGAVYGVSANVRTNCIRLANPSTEFVTNELWAVEQYAGGSWAEAGITAGSGYPSGLHAFTARWDPVDGYRQWDWGTVSANSYYQVVLWQDSSLGQWWMTVGGAGTHTSAITSKADLVLGGVETNSNHTNNDGSLSSMQWESLERNWYSPWGTSNTPLIYLRTDTGTYAHWVSINSWLQMGTNAC